MADESKQVFLTTDTSPSWRAYFITLLIGSLLGFGGGWMTHKAFTDGDWLAKLHDLQAKLLHAENKPPIIKEVVRTQTNTEVAYIPKETIRYIDPRTGREISAQELESLNVNIKQPEFYFTVNGHAAKFTKEQDERWVFDKNKGLLSQTSTASIDIKVPTVDKTKRFGVGAIVSNKGTAPLIEFRPGLLEVGVFYAPDFYGGKITARF